MPNTPRLTRGLKFIQALLGLGATLCIAVPFLRRTHGLKRLSPAQKYLFVSNHVSLLDTILLGGLCWRSGCYPILTLADKAVWQASWIRRLLSRRTGFLMERGKLNPHRLEELQAFARCGREFHLIVFPEGTRGDGVSLAPFQPGIYHIAQEARLPVVPVFIANMQCVSTKGGRFHPLGGLHKVEVHYGEPIPPEKYLPLSREEFLQLLQSSVAALQSAPARVRVGEVSRPAGVFTK